VVVVSSSAPRRCFQPSDEGATIANQFGYGTELSTV
jgi:hypothetical protein